MSACHPAMMSIPGSAISRGVVIVVLILLLGAAVYTASALL
jgi:hypothetical protein